MSYFVVQKNLYGEISFSDEINLNSDTGGEGFSDKQDAKYAIIKFGQNDSTLKYNIIYIDEDDDGFKYVSEYIK